MLLEIEGKNEYYFRNGNSPKWTFHIPRHAWKATGRGVVPLGCCNSDRLTKTASVCRTSLTTKNKEDFRNEKEQKMISLFVLVVCLFTQIVLSGNASATQIPQTSTPDSTSAQTSKASIPGRMAPDTIIRYDSPTHYTIQQGGPCSEVAQKELDALLKEKQKFLNENRDEIKNGSLIVIEDPTPVAGMVVEYDGEGYLKKITPDNEDYTIPNSGNANLAAGGRYASNGTYTFGNHKNKITITNSTVTGSGQFTNFTDTIEERDNHLAKGDVATKASLDNPPYGTSISCTARGHRATMVKHDNGGLPDACLDIWKYGVQEFGVSWNQYISIDNASFSHHKV